MPGLSVKPLTELTLADLWREVKDEEAIWGDIDAGMLRMAKVLMEASLEEELVVLLGAARYRRTEQRRGYRNGFYERDLATQIGIVRAIRVPRPRGMAFEPKTLERYRRRRKQVDRAVREMFLAGVSTRRVGEVLERLMGEAISAQTVSRIAGTLDREVEGFHRRWLGDNYLYLILDGIYLKERTGVGARRRLVLCAYGVGPQGQRQLLDFRLATAESEAQWEAFLTSLARRGLTGHNLRLVVTDGCPGLHRALETVYPYAARQRCWAHKLRNVTVKVPQKLREECLAGARHIYLAVTRRQAVRAYWAWAHQWREAASKAVACLEQDMPELLAFLGCPKEHHVKVRTTNAIERAFREVRRRTRPMSCLNNPASCERIIYGVVRHLNQSWEDKPLRQFTH